MKLHTMRRASGVAALTLVLSAGLAACGDDDSSTGGDDGEAAGAEQFGDACSQIPKDGEGSLTGMTDDPVGTAASNNPLLKTLVKAVTAADLVGTLNDAEALTVFAPYDGAFEAIDPKVLTATLKDKAGLTTILTHHVIGERLDPEAVVGEHDTLAKDKVTVDGDTDGMTVKGALTGGDATVLCGNIQTKNATVYVIDKVLMPGA